jgi:hypothetical protein
MEMCDIDESTAMDLLEAHGWSIERALDLCVTPTQASRWLVWAVLQPADEYE